MAKCSVSWCHNSGKSYYSGNRVTKKGQEYFELTGTCFADFYYKTQYWMCNMHSDDYRDDKSWDKFQEQNSIASRIYTKVWQ